MADYDLAIIGGGLTGASIARDAAGRGLRVVLFEQGDLAGGASSASPRLIGGDLGQLERRAFASVRTALIERDRLIALAPHLVRAARFVIPLHPQGRPPWLLRLGLSAYDRLASRPSLPGATSIDLTHHETGTSLQRPFGSAFEFSDALADDSRLVVANALDAAARGAEIRLRARCVRADRDAEWRIMVVDRGHRRTISSRALVNATGAWVGQVAETVLRVPPPSIHLVRETQILVGRLFEHDRGYVLQQPAGRLIFATPYEADLTLIGTASGAFKGDLAAIAPSAEDIAMLCSAANRYFRAEIAPADVVGTVCGVRALPAARARVPRSGVIDLERRFHEAPLVTTFGGDLTTHRLRAEMVLERLASFYAMAGPWTATAPLPGGEFEAAALDEHVLTQRARYPFLSTEQASRLVRAYGTRVPLVLGDARSLDDLGIRFGTMLTAREVRYLMSAEWAQTPEDVLWRRSKLGLSSSAAEWAALAQYMKSVA